MKRVKCHPKKNELRLPPNYEVFVWEVTAPFCVNPRGILTHRVRSGMTHQRNGEPTHHSVSYWCNNGHCISLDNVALELVDDPPKDRLLCAFCEANAIAAEERSADKLVGRHVHKGRLIARRTCCQAEGN